MSEMEPHAVERLPELTEREAFDLLYWSFWYSQGATNIQKLMFNYIRRDYTLPTSFSALYRAAPSEVYDEYSGKRRFDDDFDLPDQELQRFKNLLSGEHVRNTGNQIPVNAGQIIHEQVGIVIGELINPSEYNDYSKQRIREELVLCMLEEDYRHAILRNRKKSQVLQYLVGDVSPPGPPMLIGLVRELRDTLSYLQDPENKMEVTVDTLVPRQQARMAVVEVLDALRDAAHS